jgi:hypothetical protein
MELMGCKCSFSAFLIGDRFLLARKRLEFVMGRGSTAISDDMDVRSKSLGGRGLGDFYRVVIQEIVALEEPTTGRALSVLSWIWKSKEPLTERVLQEAIGADSTARILWFCNSLVVFSDSGYFQFSHTTTVTEFLANTKLEDLGARLPSSLDLTKKCLTYLNESAEFESLQPVDPVGLLASATYELRDGDYDSSNGFGGYAATRWPDHILDTESYVLLRGVEDLFRFEFLASNTKRDLVLKLNHRSTILHLLADRGLAGLCSMFFEAKARYTDSIASPNV